MFVSKLLCLLYIHVPCQLRRMPDNVAGKIGELSVMNCTSNDTTRPCGYLFWKRQTSKTSEQTDISLQDVHCPFLRMPENVAGKIGEEVAMNCASNDTTSPCGNLVWARQNPKSSRPNDISKLDTLSDLVSKYIAFIDSSNGNCNLNITMRASAEGTYECTDAATLKAVTAQLIVLEDDPECVIRTDEKVFNITCSVRFLGSWSPTMQWFQVNGSNSLPIDAYYESIIPNQIVASTVLLDRVNVSNGRGHKTLGLRCSVNFTEDRRPDKTSATNVPDYEWTSPIFGGSNEEQLDATSKDPPDNNVPYVATIAVLAVVIGVFVIAAAVCAFALCTGRLKISLPHGPRQAGQGLTDETGEL